MLVIKDKKYVNRWIKTGIVDDSGNEYVIKFDNQIANVPDKYTHLVVGEDFEIIGGQQEVPTPEQVKPVVSKTEVVKEKPLDEKAKKVENKTEEIITEDSEQKSSDDEI